MTPVTVPSGSDEVIATVTAWPDAAVAGGGVHVMAGGLSITVITGVADDVEPLLSWTVTVMVKVAEGVPFANEYAWLSVVGGPDIVSVVPSPQFTVVVAMVPSGSEAEMVMMTVCPGVTVVEDRVGVTVGGLSVMVTV